ncbi:ubiquinol oxidase 4, chloroplastic/chromoplastic, partial [Quercus suber]|uniref:ubiquinol oxidase 4, chloroplastic/chromoplastic n=1 Tax=Quercus suber TaxID=58331 RepID=UPI0032DEFCC0
LYQSFQDSVIKILDTLYHDRDYPRFFVLETIARVPYFAFMSVLHMYESFGWWRRADYIKVHFAESWNEMHHLLIMEELGGNAWWIDRFLAQHIAVAYYFMTALMYVISPRMAYHFSECVEGHAFETYDKFIKAQGEELKKLPAPEVAVKYYTGGDLYLFDEFQTARTPNSRRPKIVIPLCQLIRDSFVFQRLGCFSGKKDWLVRQTMMEGQTFFFIL